MITLKSRHGFCSGVKAIEEGINETLCLQTLISLSDVKAQTEPIKNEWRKWNWEESCHRYSLWDEALNGPYIWCQLAIHLSSFTLRSLTCSAFSCNNTTTSFTPYPSSQCFLHILNLFEFIKNYKPFSNSEISSNPLILVLHEGWHFLIILILA